MIQWIAKVFPPLGQNKKEGLLFLAARPLVCSFSLVQVTKIVQ